MSDISSPSLLPVASSGCACGSCGCGARDDDARAASESSATPNATAMVTVIGVQGMTCAHCVASVSEEVGGIDGVIGVDVDLVADGVSEVRVSADRALAPKSLRHAIEEAGYQLADVQR